MSDIDNLRQRIEQAELRLKTAHTARQRESAALTSMWDQIRDRFTVQSTEIVRLRERVATLEDTRDELNSMVRTLLGSVENSIERMADETVPHITVLAEDMLEAAPPDIGREPYPAAAAPQFSPPGRDPAAFVASTAPDQPAETDPVDDDFVTMLSADLDRDEAEDDISVPSSYDAAREGEEPASPGIRNLITRIEGAFERKTPAPGLGPAHTDPADPRDEDLARDLDDIRRLREELQSLRTRIGATG